MADVDFPGILAILAEIYADARPDYREELTEYMSPVPCPACHGKRLRTSSLAVRVRNLSIGEFVAMPISRALLTARSWQFVDRELQIAGRIVDEIRRRLEFLESVGLHYLSLDRQRLHAFGWRSSAYSPGYSDRLETAWSALCAR